MRKIFVAVLLTVGSLLPLSGCGSSSTVTITDSITPSGTLALDAGQSVAFTAKVNNDPANAGVTWQLLDSSGGQLTQITKTSATYVAPATLTAQYITLVNAFPVNAPRSSATTTINVFPALAATTPTLTAGRVAAAYTYQFASSGGAAPLVWKLASGALPAGLTLSASGLLSGMPTASGTFTFSVSVTDSATTPQTIQIFETLNIVAANLAITTATVPAGLTSQPYSVTLTSQYGTAPVTWALAAGSALPAGLTLSSAGVISGTPSTAGSTIFSVQATDSSTTPLKASATFTINIYAPLAITTASLPDGSVKNAYSQQLTSTGGQAPVTWSLTSGTLPAGLTLSPAGLISGTPTAAVASTPLTFKATDAYSPAQTATVNLTLNIVLSTLAITTTTVPSGTTGHAYSTQLTSTGGNAPITWSLATGSTLPAGLTLSSTGLLSGSPTAVSTTTFTVQATDTTPATVTQTYTLKVVAASLLQIDTASLPAGNIGSPYSTTLVASLGTTPYTWTVFSGALPSGYTLSSAGVLSGTTFIGGTYNVTFSVADSTGASVTKAFTLTIGSTLSGGTANGLLKGSYALLITGRTAPATVGDGKSYGRGTLGSFTADGNGNLSGIADVNDGPTGVQTAQALTGTYAVNTDGRGLLSITLGTQSSVYAVALSSQVSGIAQYAAFTGFDNSTGTGLQSSGYALAQTTSTFAASTVKNTFVFGLSGESACSTCATAVKYGPIAAAGLLTADGVSTISSGTEDISAYGGGTSNYSSLGITGTFTSPSTTTGRGTLKLTYTGTQIGGAPTNYTYIIVNASQLLLLSNDTHTTSALLSGEARLQQISSYTSANAFPLLSVGYETQAAGGDGATTYPGTSNAILSALNYTSAGVGTLLVDANHAGTVTLSQTKSLSFTTGTTGRNVFNVTGAVAQTVYLYAQGSGFGIDLSTATTYPALIHYEPQVPNTTAQMPLLSGTFAFGTPFVPVLATLDSGLSTWSFYSGGVNAQVLGKLSTTTDVSTPSGSLTQAQTASDTYAEDSTGRLVIADSTSATTAVAYGISGTRSVSLPTSTTNTTPVITVFQK
ncbi:MAG: putative Ig domain-containing protein [Acidobacteriaceae bacterium]|nr:putative Ig domain-containing protein [Acidobacteriaceae bacterium]